MGVDVRCRYQAELASVPEARRLVARSLDEWGMGAVADDAALCTAELVTNAVLHAGTDLEVSVARLGAGVEVTVRDNSPRRLPAADAEDLPASDLDAVERLLAESMSGRGLRVVDTVASAWGVDYGEHDKAVWFRLLVGHDDHEGRAAGGTDRRSAARPDDGAGVVTVRLEGLPVRASVASGANVDDILREFQLLGRDPEVRTTLSPLVIADVERLLDRSVEDRMASRAAARAAAADGETRFSMDVRLPVWGADRVGALNEVLDRVAEASRAGELLAMPPDDEVVWLRAWCAEEIARQAGGAPPRPCPVPD